MSTFRVTIYCSMLLALLAIGFTVQRAHASDEYLFTASPLTDLSTVTNGALVIDFNQNGPRQRWTLGGNITISALNNARPGLDYTLWFRQDATGSRTVAWPSNVKWAGGSAPTITTAAGKQDKITILWDAANAGWLASVSQNY